MAALKRRREDPCTPEAPPVVAEWSFPADILLEIVARSDICSLIRCAAVCKLLRGDILSPGFIRRVTQQEGIVPHCILAYLNIPDDEDDPPPHLSLVHPATPAAMSFLDDHMSPYMSCFANDLLGDYYPLKSRGGLVLLRRRGELSNLCVYDPITGSRTFLSCPPRLSPKQTRWFDRCVFLTAADGIGSSFLLFVPYLGTMPGNSYTSTIKVQTATSTCGTCEPAVTSDTNGNFFWQHWKTIRHDTVVLQGGAIHWLVRHRFKIISYNIYTMKQGTINLPDPVVQFRGQLHLGSYYSHHRQKLLKLLAAYGSKISVWHQLPGGDWASEAVMINMEEKLRSLDPDIRTNWPLDIEFKYAGNLSNVVLLHITIYSAKWHIGRRTFVVTLDLETKEMHKQHYSTSSSVLLEVDPSSCLRAMEVFPW